MGTGKKTDPLLCLSFLDMTRKFLKKQTLPACQLPAVFYKRRTNHDTFFSVRLCSFILVWLSGLQLVHNQTSCFVLAWPAVEEAERAAVSPVRCRRRCEEQVWIGMASVTSLNRPTWLRAGGVIGFGRRFAISLIKYAICSPVFFHLSINPFIYFFFCLFVLFSARQSQQKVFLRAVYLSPTSLHAQLLIMQLLVPSLRRIESEVFMGAPVLHVSSRENVNAQRSSLLIWLVFMFVDSRIKKIYMSKQSKNHKSFNMLGVFFRKTKEHLKWTEGLVLPSLRGDDIFRKILSPV